jgi:electron transfer flavoprotein beta subunit
VLLLARRDAAPPGVAPAELLGSCDDAALRAALALEGATVTALAAGSAEREDPLLEHMLAAGAARAARVYDPGVDGVDYHGVARVLAAAARHLGYDLLLCGERSAGEGQGALGPAVAEALGVPHVSAALDVRADRDGLLVERRDGGVVRTLRVALPALVTVTRSPAPPRPPRAGATAAIATLELAALGIHAPELRHRAAGGGQAAPWRRGAILLPDAGALIARLREESLL